MTIRLQDSLDLGTELAECAASMPEYQALAHEANVLLVRICDELTRTYNSTLPMAVYQSRIKQLKRLRVKAYARLCRRLERFAESLAAAAQRTW